MLNYRFYIACDKDGNLEPFMRFGPSTNHVHLEKLARGHMASSIGAQRELDGIQKVLNDEIPVHSFGWR